jgi:hypothetical protein
MSTTKIDFTRVNNDVNGNPRYVCHFLTFITDSIKNQVKEDFASSLSQNQFRLTEFLYDEAIYMAKKIGGKKFHNKQYGGGIVFQSYNIQDTEKSILELIN